MTEGYTRGPWEYVPGTEHHGPYVTTGWGSDVCDCYTMSNLAAASIRNGGDSYPINFQGKEAEANARLIAASPDLLAFAKAYDAFMAAHYSGPDSYALHPDAANNWRMCRAAIARAEGGNHG